MRLRRSPLATLVLAITLLSVGIGDGMSERSHAIATLNGDLTTAAGQQAEMLDDYFSRAQSIDLLTAHNPAFREFYQLPGSRTGGGRARLIRAGGPVLDKANEALGYLERLFPHSIGEACFIDRSGAEVARVVRGQRATPADLAPDESANPFFRPTFAQRHGDVYQAAPYVSPDTDEWVISNSTLMPTADGSKQAIVHFEITMESFRQHAALNRQFDVAIVDARTGAVVIDSRLPQRVGAKLGNPDDHRFRPLVVSRQPAGRLLVGDRPAAYQRAKPLPGNANQWYVAAVAREPVGLLYGIGAWPIGLVVVALLLLVLAGLWFRAGERVLVAAAMTDALTGIGNRRKLMADLEQGLATASESRPLLLMLFDLDGFKAYNDTFGHPAGDSLLARLGAALQTAMRGRGHAYRLGGDEFCILAPVGADGTDPTIAAAAAALTEHGDGFSVTASYGAVLLPTDSRDAGEAMRMVDQRMYAQKTSGRRSADRQSKDVLLRALYERNPELIDRFRSVAGLAAAVGERMGVAADERHQLQQAAELHDVGKVAIPDAILHKPGPLDEEEWAFVRRHSLIGERIIGAAPALARAAKLVRSTHERFDGTGYPDALAGEQIPLGARIISACDAYAAMTFPRPYATRMTKAQAISELTQCAGTQFDPQVVAVLTGVLAEQTDGRPLTSAASANTEPNAQQPAS
jgi:diguanylate cyclase (GGDEF)-like protein